MDILVCGFQRSGNTLLANIIGSHSDVGIPSGNVFFWTFIHHKFSNKFFKNNDSHQLLEALSSKAIGRTNLNFTTKQMKELSKCISIDTQSNLKNLIDCSLSIYKKGKGKRISGVKDPGAEMYTNDILKMYPKCKILHVVRDPFSIIASKKMSLEVDKSKHIDPIFYSQLSQSILRSEIGMKMHPYNYYVVRYEDIIENTENTVRKLCSFLDIEYENGMLEMRGNNDWNNIWGGTNTSFDREKFKGVSKVALNRRGYLTNFEKYYISKKFKIFINLYDYKIPLEYPIFRISYLIPLAFIGIAHFLRLCLTPIRSILIFSNLIIDVILTSLKKKLI